VFDVVEELGEIGVIISALDALVETVAPQVLTCVNEIWSECDSGRHSVLEVRVVVG